MTDAHDIHDFVIASQRAIEEEYRRIQKRAAEDPGTAGDQGEENWKALLASWLPSYFHIVTKGRILTASGYASPQVDVLVLWPSYPKILLDKKLYLAGGVAAAFECKITLKADHVKTAVQTAAELRRNLPKRKGSPYKELNSRLLYGLLAHSHSWKNPGSNPVNNIDSALWEADQQHVQHPIECIDFITVADLASWATMKMIMQLSEKMLASKNMAEGYGPKGSCITGYMCHENQERQQKAFFSPIGVLLSGLFSKLAWTLPDMRTLEQYFRSVNMLGIGAGKSRKWGLNIYSESIIERVVNGKLTQGISYDEWSALF